MKTIVRGFILLAALSSAVSAAPFLRFGDNSEVFLLGDVSVRFDDNVLLTQSNETDDTIVELSPGAEFVFGRNALFNGRITYLEHVKRYIDSDNLNSELSDLALVSKYDDEKSKFTFDTSFKQLNENTRDVRGPFLVRRDVFNLSLGSETAVSQKTTLGAGLDFDHTHFKRVGYIDSNEMGVPLNIYYGIAPKLDLSAGFRYRETDLGVGGADSADYFYNIGARGEFTPKLTGQLNIGWDQRKVQGGRDESLLGLESKLTYQVSEKTAVLLTLGNDFDTSAEGESQENFLAGLATAINLTADWRVTGGVAYRKVDYFRGRTDDFFDFQAGATYILNEYVKLTAGFEHRNNDSDLTVANFDNNVFSLGIKIRY